ncbi:MAG: RluA family pseudouridine synthase [Lachnospirales bacterium]
MNSFKIDDEESVNIRIDKFLFDQLNVSRSHIKKKIDEGQILVNQEITKASYKLRLDDEIEILDIEPKVLKIKEENIPLDIFYEDQDVIVINKPQGMVVHPAPGNYSGTLVNALIYHCKDLSGINGELRPGIVHRIDKNTSGLLVCTKNDNAHNFLAEQFFNHTIKREYYAITVNNVVLDKGTINKPLARHGLDRKKRAIDRRGKEAITHYEVIERYSKYTLVRLTLETGRTHQIRVHLASIGNAVLGDDMYSQHKGKLNLQGQLLHAKTLGFIHPTTKEYMEFDSPLPEHFLKAIRYIKSN